MSGGSDVNGPRVGFPVYAAGTLAWEVKGWQRSGEPIETVAAELAAGPTPSPTPNPAQVIPGPT